MSTTGMASAPRSAAPSATRCSSDLPATAPGGELGQLLQELRSRCLVAAIDADEQEPRRIRGREQLAEQPGAVDVPPLEIVDHDQELPLRGDPAKDLLQRAKRVRPGLV